MMQGWELKRQAFAILVFRGYVYHGPLIVCYCFPWATLPCMKVAHEKRRYLRLITLQIILLLLKVPRSLCLPRPSPSTSPPRNKTEGYDQNTPLYINRSVCYDRLHRNRKCFKDEESDEDCKGRKIWRARKVLKIWEMKNRTWFKLLPSHDVTSIIFYLLTFFIRSRSRGLLKMFFAVTFAAIFHSEIDTLINLLKVAMRYIVVAMITQGDSENEWVFWVLVSNMWCALTLFFMGHLNMGQLAHGKQ